MADTLDSQTKGSRDLPRGFHWLEVSDIARETSEAISVTFAVPDNLAENFSYIQGQYLTLMRDFGGERLRRPYSLWFGPDEGKLKICKIGRASCRERV